jgi:hypothetical protein
LSRRDMVGRGGFYPPTKRAFVFPYGTFYIHSDLGERLRRMVPLEYIIAWLVPVGLVQPGHKEDRDLLLTCLLSIPCMLCMPLAPKRAVGKYYSDE